MPPVTFRRSVLTLLTSSSVDELITTYPVDPPFRGAILQSGQTSFYVNLDNDPASWNTLASALNCSTSTDVLACVRAADVLTIKSIVEHLALSFGPHSDNVTQLQFPELARATGNIAKVPIMTGITGLRFGVCTT